MKLLVLVSVSSALICSTTQLFSQEHEDDSVRVVLDTIIVIGTRSTMLSPAHIQSQQELFSLPGGFHDPLRAVDVLPFAAVTSDVQAQPAIGGDDPDRVLTLLDGFEILAPYRLLGAFSVFNPLMIKSVNATTTGYPARCGGFFPSAVEVQSENEPVNKTFVSAETTLPMSQVVVGAPLNTSTGLSARLGVRTSHLGVVRPILSAFAKDRDVDAFLPNMSDAQWGITFSPSQTLGMRQLGIVAQETGALQSYARTFSYGWRKLFQALTLEWQPRENWGLITRISFQSNNADLTSIFPLESLGDQTFAMSSALRQARISSEADIALCASATLSCGAELTRKTSEQSFIGSSEYLRPPPSATTSFTDVGLFVEPRRALWDRFDLTFGERLWYSGAIAAGGNESRLNVGLRLGQSTRVEAGFGEYSQPPSDVQVLYGYLSFLAQPNQPPRLLLMSQSKKALAPEESTVLFARVHHTFLSSEALSGMITADIYGKDESAVILSQRYPSVFTPVDSNSFLPSQQFEGKKWGIGVSLLLHHAASGIRASVSYARQSSVMTDAKSAREIPTGSDRHHLVKAMIKCETGSWNISATFQYYSGAPTTDRYFLQSRGIFGDSFFVPVWKDLNSGRLPSYNRLDVFISKTFDIESWVVTPYVDLVNLLNTRNVSQYDYTLNPSRPPDYANADPVYNSLPFLPMIGVRLRKEW